MAVSTTFLPSRRSALRAFVASIVVSALAGIWALLAGEFDSLQVKVLLSSLAVSSASLCAMGGAAQLEGRGERLPAVPGIVLAGVALALILAGLWSETGDEAYWKSTSTVSFFAVACAHGSLLRLARLSPRHAWLGLGTIAVAFVLAAYGAALLWAESEQEAHFRALGVLSILVAAGTLATPVAQRLASEDGGRAARPAAEGGVDMLCPACGARLREPLGDVRCPGCSARFRIELVDA